MRSHPFSTPLALLDSVAMLIAGAILAEIAAPAALAQDAPPRPNIVWIVLDDAGADMGCYGDPLAVTPNMDRLAREGARFTRAHTTTPVCAPSRAALVSGMYPTTTGTHHMRSRVIAPPVTFMEKLREAGYRVAWPGKTDFNFPPPAGAFDSTADWLESPPAEPFFAYMNLASTHEGQVRLGPEKFAKVTAALGPAERHDPAKMAVPPYYPDAPEVRESLAHYYDLMTVSDRRVGEILDALERQGLVDRTADFLFSDHGRGMPRCKRWLYESGIRVPLIVRWPGRIEAGSTRDDFVSFIDFAPTVLSLAGASLPPAMQGRIFLGPAAAPPPRFVFAHRDRMDETFDRVRALTDGRFKYIRNFHPELPYAQRIAYNEENPIMQVWRRLDSEGKLTGAPALFFRPVKPAEELYDLAADPDEIHDLAGEAEHGERLAGYRAAMDEWIDRTGDLGEIPEEELSRRGVVEDRLKEYEGRKVGGRGREKE